MADATETISSLIPLIQNDTVRRVFNAIAEHQFMTLFQLQACVNIDQREAEAAVKKLRNLRLVREESGDSITLLHLTAKGLGAWRDLQTVDWSAA